MIVWFNYHIKSIFVKEVYIFTEAGMFRQIVFMKQNRASIIFNDRWPDLETFVQLVDYFI